MSQSDTSPSVLDSDETAALLDAISEHSQRYPQIVTVQGTAPTGWDVAMADIVADWGPQHRIDSIRYPLEGQKWQELERQDVLLYLDASSAYQMRFLEWQPTAAYWLTYTKPHVLNSSTDTLSAQRPGEIEAVAHLAASNILRMAANARTQQYDSTLSADSADTAGQGSNYAIRATDERAEYERRLLRSQSGNGPVDWGYPPAGHADLFWRTRRNR